MISREPTIERLATAERVLLEPYGLNEATLARALAGEKTAFAYSDELSEAALLDAARRRHPGCRRAPAGARVGDGDR